MLFFVVVLLCVAQGVVGQGWVSQNYPYSIGQRLGAVPLSLQGKFYLLGGWSWGQYNDAWVTSDGQQWDPAVYNLDKSALIHAAWAVRDEPGNTGVVIMGGMNSPEGVYGYSQEIQTNTDPNLSGGWGSGGAPWGARASAAAVYFNGVVVHTGGRSCQDISCVAADVWASTNTDGEWNNMINAWAWTKLTANAAFGPRFGHSLSAFADAIYLTGGTTGTSLQAFNDVWKSTDMTHWTQVTANGGYSKRMNAVVISVPVTKQLFMIGGGVPSSNEPYNSAGDVLTDQGKWYVSNDAIHWTAMATDLPNQPYVFPQAGLVGDHTLITAGGSVSNEVSDQFMDVYTWEVDTSCRCSAKAEAMWDKLATTPFDTSNLFPRTQLPQQI
jgi:hypothetical protein